MTELWSERTATKACHPERSEGPAFFVFALVFLALLACAPLAHALGEPRLITLTPTAGAFPIAAGGKATPILVSDKDWPGVQRAAEDLRHDIEHVTGVLPTLGHESQRADAILVGTIGRSPLIDALIQSGKLQTAGIAGQWEAGVTTVVEDPMPGIHRALVIAGSDKRGTIFGVYTLSEAIGVSPWSWWADVRIPHHDALYALPGTHPMPPPAVKYRGIFLNDEAPALSNWAKAKFGGKNRQFYAHVFELLLRLRANYLWPAMWDNAFNEDDPADPALADSYGIVMGTSHHEPMLRAQQEWKRHGTGPWDYTANQSALDKFWAQGIARNKHYESTITVGMRGDGDMAMSANANTSLLETIVANQRRIIAAFADPAVKNPQVWALYKEVQEYYEKGMRVPDDVTLLWCDDNWGNLRRLPTPEERARPGGAGIYYHFDYVGDPRSYKWLNTYSITKVQEQMRLALDYGADRLWIVNVGDLKPMEFPTEFFLTMARDPARYDKDRLTDYTTAWAEREFGTEHAAEIADIVARYTQYNSRRKPEQLEPTTFSLTEDHEADRVEQEWRELEAHTEAVRAKLPEDEQASYFELVGYPVHASATVTEMYIAAGRNHLYAHQGRASANLWADETRRLFAQDAALSAQYNHLLNGRWNHMMDQTHIGYTFWSEPPFNTMPAVQQVQPPDAARLAVFPEGDKPQLTFDRIPQQTRTIDLAPTGSRPVSFEASASAPWIHLSRAEGTLTADATLDVSVDWPSAPAEAATARIVISQRNAEPIEVAVHLSPSAPAPQGFLEVQGVITIDAEHATARRDAQGVQWQTLPGFGETLSAVEAFPTTAPSSLPGAPQACLDYRFTTAASGKRSLRSILAPTLSFTPGRGLRFGVALDQSPQIVVDAWKDNSQAHWKKAVSDGVNTLTAPLGQVAAGTHTLHLCRIDPGVAVERLILYGATAPTSYLGPRESPTAQ